MEFDVYNYRCSLLSDDHAFSAEDAPVKKEHVELIDRILTADKLNYPVSARMGVPFKVGKQLLLIRKDACKRNGEGDKPQAEWTLPYSKAYMLYAHEGFYVMSVQNKAILSSERGWAKYYDFKKPSYWVILINTSGRQLLLVRANSVFNVFRSTQAVADIFEDTFKALLKPYRLNVHICPLASSGTIFGAMGEAFGERHLYQEIPFRPKCLRMALDAEVLIALAKGMESSSKAKSAMENFRKNVEDQLKNWPNRLTPEA